MQETQVWSIGWRKKTATHSSILAWETPWSEEPGGLQSMGHKKVRHDFKQQHTHLDTKAPLYKSDNGW